MTTLALTRPQAAALCGLTPSGFDSWVQRGIVPPPIPGTRRWSRADLERALGGQSAEKSLDPFEEWKPSQKAPTKAKSDAPVTPLGKREKSVLLQLLARRGHVTRDADLEGAGPSTILKLGERGYLVPHGPYYFDLVLTDAGLGAAEVLLAASVEP